MFFTDGISEVFQPANERAPTPAVVPKRRAVTGGTPPDPRDRKTLLVSVKRVLTTALVVLMFVLGSLALVSCESGGRSTATSSPTNAAGYRNVSTGGLDFSVPRNWSVLPARKYGGCIIRGPAVIVGIAGTSETCDGSTVQRDVVIRIAPLGNATVVPPTGSASVQTIHGIVVTIRSGSAPRAESRTASGPPTSGDDQSLSATFSGYSVQFGATGIGSDPGSALRSARTVLASVRPAG